jgi:hypothetical protein
MLKLKIGSSFFIFAAILHKGMLSLYIINSAFSSIEIRSVIYKKQNLNSFGASVLCVY